MMKKSLFIPLLVVCAFCNAQTTFAMGAYGDNTYDSIDVNGRTLVEKHHTFSRGEYYLYYVADIVSKVEEAKKTMRYYDNGGWITDPVYRDHVQMREERGRFLELCNNCFAGNKKGMSPSDILIHTYFLLDNNGNVLCQELQTEVSLFELYTPQEVLDIFDKINSFKFTAPVLRTPPHSVDSYIEF